MTLKLHHVVFCLVVACVLAWSASAATPRLASEPFSCSSFVIDASGTLYSWGANWGGMLGIGNENSQPTPTLAPFPPGVHAWQAVASGAGFNNAVTLAIADNGQLYGAGTIDAPPYSFGQAVTYLSPLPDPEGTGWTDAAVGYNEGWLALTGNGKLYGSTPGLGTSQYPAPPTGTRWTKVAISEDEIITLADNGRIYSASLNITTPPQPPGLTEVPIPAGATAWTNIFTGARYKLALANDGNLYGWGCSFVCTNVPQLVPLPAGAGGWKAISSGSWHILALTSDGAVYAWGGNDHGQLGVGDTVSRMSPTRVSGLSNVTAIAAGYLQSMAIADCKTWCWGANYIGQLGTGSVGGIQTVPVPALLYSDICATNSAALPLVSIAAADDTASEGTWLSLPGHPVTNTAAFQVSRLFASNAPLPIQFAIGGTASNGVDYFALSGSVTIPAGSNSASVLIVPTGVTLPVSSETITITLSADPAYNLGNPTNVLITLLNYQDQPTPPMPPIPVVIEVGTNTVVQVFSIEASTNLLQWAPVATVTNMSGVVSFTDTNGAMYRVRFFRAVPLPTQ